MRDNAEMIQQVAEYFSSIIGTKQEENLGVVSSLIIKRYALAVGDNNPLYHEKAFAQEHSYSDIVAPPNLLVSIVQWGTGAEESHLHRDGTPFTDGILPQKFEEIRLMGGGESMNFLKPVTAGTHVTLESEVTDSYTKQGKTGLIAFLVITNTYSNKNGENLAICQRTMIAR